MIGLILFAVLIVLATVWFLARAVRTQPVSMAVDRDGLEQLRERLLAQLRELEVEEGDRNVDDKIAADERVRLEAELARVLRDLEASSSPGPSTDSVSARPVWLATVFVLVLVLPLVSMSLYFLTSAGTLRELVQAPAPRAQVARGEVPPMAREMVARLEQRLKDQPNDPQGWARLGRSYEVLGRDEDAKTAYARAYQLASENPEIILDYATFLMSRDQSQMSAETVGLFQKLHKLQPQNPGALWALGFASYQEKNFSGAVAYWDQLLKLLPPDSEVVPQLKHAIDSARSEAAKAK